MGDSIGNEAQNNHVVPTMKYPIKHSIVMNWDLDSIGNEAQNNHVVSTLKYPIKHVIVMNWDLDSIGNENQNNHVVSTLKYPIKHSIVMHWDLDSIGNEAQSNHVVSALKYPIKHVIVMSWDLESIVKIWTASSRFERPPKEDRARARASLPGGHARNVHGIVFRRTLLGSTPQCTEFLGHPVGLGPSKRWGQQPGM